MEIIDIILISIGVAMDAFAVAICKGLSMKKMNWKKALIIGTYFGFFQMIMPIIGYLLGIGFDEWFEKFDHWIAFILLAFIGGKMIKESFRSEECLDDKVNFNSMFFLALATSIDALAIGVTYGFLDVSNCMEAFASIGIITFILSIFGVKIGNKFGNKFGKKAEVIGGIILICMGFEILIEHLYV